MKPMSKLRIKDGLVLLRLNREYRDHPYSVPYVVGRKQGVGFSTIAYGEFGSTITASLRSFDGWTELPEACK
jgi:hypothetical protein